MRGREIGVGKKRDRRLRREQSGADGVAFAAILGKAQNARGHFGAAGKEFFRHLRRPSVEPSSTTINSRGRPILCR